MICTLQFGAAFTHRITTVTNSVRFIFRKGTFTITSYHIRIYILATHVILSRDYLCSQRLECDLILQHDCQAKFLNVDESGFLTLGILSR